MAYELRDGQGSLFKNNRKTEDKHPDMTGSIKLLDGSEHWFSAWTKQSNGGAKFLSVQIGNPKQERAAPPPRRPPPGIQPPGGNAPVSPRRGSMKPDDMDDGVPFEMEWR